VTVSPTSPQPPSVIDRVFAILEACAASHRTLSLADLARMTGLPKATLHRLCWRLCALGALEHHADGFRIGPRLFALGAINPTIQRLRVQSMPFLHSLSAETGLVADLGVLEGDKALLVDEVFAQGKPIPRMVGALMPLHATAVGKALLSAISVGRYKTLLGDEPLQSFTPHTITGTDRLLEELAVAVETGVVYSREEWRLGLSAIAAPLIVDGVVTAAIGLVGIPQAAGANETVEAAIKQAAAGVAAALRRPVIFDPSSDFGEQPAPL
jgi:DNA-binding IclR family transcriptional regulator